MRRAQGVAWGRRGATLASQNRGERGKKALPHRRKRPHTKRSSHNPKGRTPSARALSPRRRTNTHQTFAPATQTSRRAFHSKRHPLWPSRSLTAPPAALNAAPAARTPLPRRRPNAEGRKGEGAFLGKGTPALSPRASRAAAACVLFWLRMRRCARAMGGRARGVAGR